MMTEMADMADHNKAFESIILNGETVVKGEGLEYYACAMVKKGRGEFFPFFFFSSSSSFSFFPSCSFSLPHLYPPFQASKD